MPPVIQPIFALFLRDALAAAQGSTLMDGKCTLPYAVVPEHLEAVVSFLTDRGVSPGSLVALECTNSVAGALTLLALLSRQYSFVLIAPAKDENPDHVPRFCRFRVMVRSTLANGPQIDLRRPNTFLDVIDMSPEGTPIVGTAAAGRLLLRTSGSIGAPKLAVYDHEKLLGNALRCVPRLGLGAEDRIAIPVPLAHMFGLGAAFLPGFAAGAALDFQEGSNLLRYLERERAFRPTIAFLTPGLCTMLLRRGSPMEHYRHIVVAGDKLSPEDFHAAETRFRRVINLYGTTEMGVIAAADATADARHAATVGRPMPGVELALRPPPDGDADADDDRMGEIWCHHTHGFEGYIHGDGSAWTGEPPFDGGWYRTRDLGRWHGDGSIEVLGRVDHSVNRDGRLVLLADVERALERIPGVERAAAILDGETRRGARIVVFCTLRADSGLGASDIRAASFDVLPAYAVPDDARAVPALPMLPNGKLNRRALWPESHGESIS